MKKSTGYKLGIILVCFMSNLTLLKAQVLTSAQIDDLTERTLKTFDVPGIAVAVVKDGKIFHAKGYGVSSLTTHKKVDENTLFGIASNSKAFTCAALAILVDEGKIKWDDKVIQYIPDFKMYNTYVTEEFTIRDLLTHRSGLGLGAGDLMLWPDQSQFSIDDIIHNLRYLKPVSDFRTKFDYDNLLYIVAGEVVHKVSGKNWDQFIEERIFQPLQMDNSRASLNRVKNTSNLIDAHAPIDGKVQVIERYKNPIIDAAGGIYSSVADLSKWAILQMNDGKYGDQLEKQLFSKKEHYEMWAPQTIMPSYTTPPYNTHFSAYGLGWFLSDVKGYKQVTHTGGLEGMVTQVTLIPELKLGIIVLTNQQVGAAFNAVTNTIKNGYLGIDPIDYVTLYASRVKTNTDEANKITKEVWETIEKERKNNTKKTDNTKIIGTYKDNWLGEITISNKKGKLWFDAKKSPRLSGEVFFYKDNTYIVKWTNRSYDADAYMEFTFDEKGNGSTIKMKPISPLTDFSYDFQDLDFTRVNN
ncbi:serine hydrolase [Flavobacterium sp. '19STA2R22 D10 B1']|uniref:serine hydrolase n=1 Tax=Flavobacterium aerium TaxID=3037261 RepID=UPI00278C8D8E|nr:serine hydrolase [Flavobacterium sp. '19STA2R22 D10 B1']